MPKVTFLPSRKTAIVEVGTTLFEAASRVNLPVASSCDADATCGKCNMKIVAGKENLSPKLEWEVKLLDKEKKPKEDRISCLTTVQGDCTVMTTYW